MNQEHYRALRENAAWVDLEGRGKIYATGEDRVRLLHAMTTNHVQDLTPGRGLYAFFLTAQGRILADVNLFCLDESLLLDTEARTRGPVYEHLDRFIIADDVALDDATDRISSLALEGPRSIDLLRESGIAFPEAPYGILPWNDGHVARITSTGSEGVTFFVPYDARKHLMELIDVPMAGAGAVETVRLENGRPRYGIDFSEVNIPQETQLAHALHFSKGCYLGQEIVERVRSRGHVNRLLVSLRIQGEAAAGERLQSAGKNVGEITSAAWSPAENAVAALAIVRAEALTAASDLRSEGGAPVTQALPPARPATR